MRKYKDFKEYMEDNYLDVIMERIEPYVVGHKSFFEDEDFYQIDWVDLTDASVCGVTFKDLGDNWLEIRTSVDATVEITGRTKYGRDSDTVIKTFNVFFKGLLENGLHHDNIIADISGVTLFELRSEIEPQLHLRPRQRLSYSEKRLGPISANRAMGGI